MKRTGPGMATQFSALERVERLKLKKTAERRRDAEANPGGEMELGSRRWRVDTRRLGESIQDAATSRRN